MARRELRLINAGPNADGPEELYTDALEMLREVARQLMQHPDEADPEKLGRDITAAITILDGELKKAAE